MAEMKQGQMPLPASTEKLDYHPLSMWALAGFALALLYLGLVILIHGYGFIRSRPLFMPGWVTALAFAGAVFSYIGLRQIQASEGLLAGQSLGRWGLIISAFGGLGYIVYTFVTGLALSMQADAFLRNPDITPESLTPSSGFFPHLLKGRDKVELRKAFLLTLPASNRGGDPRSDAEMAKFHDTDAGGGKGKLSMFRDSVLAQAILVAGPDNVHIVADGMQEWTAEEGSYKVVRNYRVTTPELLLEISLPVISNEEPEGRKWFVGFANMGVRSRKLTQVGLNMKVLRAQVQHFLDQWVVELGQGKGVDFAALDKSNWDEAGRGTKIPQQYLKDQLKGLFQGKKTSRLFLDREVSLSPWEKSGDRLKIWYPFSINLEAAQLQQPYKLDGYLVVVSKKPVDVENIGNGNEAWEVDHIEIKSAREFDPMALKPGFK